MVGPPDHLGGCVKARACISETAPAVLGCDEAQLDGEGDDVSEV